MKQAQWKVSLSYIKDVLIEETSSEYNDVLEVLLVQGRYQLITDKVIYSYADKYDNFTESLKKIDFTKVKNCLVLGFGLGSIPYTIENIMGRKISYTGIEIDEEIIYLASKYVLDELKSEVSLVHADALNYVELYNSKYDLICLDLFLDDVIPSEVLTTPFIQRLKVLLKKNGTLLMNNLYFTDKDIKNTDTFIANVFSKVFPSYKEMVIDHNKMLFSN
jgi:spermidine synthase